MDLILWKSKYLKLFKIKMKTNLNLNLKLRENFLVSNAFFGPTPIFIKILDYFLRI
jgi:hypothetical protein